MATENGQQKSDLKHYVKSRYQNMGFFQLIRLLRHTYQNDVSFNKIFDSLDVHPHLSLAFPRTDVIHLQEDPTDIYEIIVTFLGLYGSSSPLPTFYTEELLEEQNEDRTALRDFYDIFNEREYKLYFLSHLKYQLGLRIHEDKDEDVLAILFSFIGQNFSQSSNNLKHIEPYELLRYAHLFIHAHRSAEGLEVFLSDMFGVEVDVIQCVSRVIKIPEENQSILGVVNTTLGEDTHIGDNITDVTGNFTVVFKGLTKEQFHDLLPNTNSFYKLREAVGLYMIENYSWNVEYEVIDAVHSSQLGATYWNQLGWNSFLYTKESLTKKHIVINNQY